MSTSSSSGPKFLVRHIGNMGDMILIALPTLAALKKQHPDCQITMITSWGYKDNRGRWGSRNQSGHSLHLLMTNPHVDQLVHWHDTKLSLGKKICHEDGQSFPTWSKAYYEKQKKSGSFDKVIELDFGIRITDNPLWQAFSLAGVDKNSPTDGRIYLTEQDKKVASFVMANMPRPRIVLTDSLQGITTRNWDPAKVNSLICAIQQQYHVDPIWFGSQTPYYHGRPLTLRENIATLTLCDVCIGALSGPLHFAAAVGLPTLALFCDHPLRRAAPAYFLNGLISHKKRKHRTLLGPAGPTMLTLKPKQPYPFLSPAQIEQQNFSHWSKPGRQSTKSCLAVITVDEVMRVLSDMI